MKMAIIGWYSANTSGVAVSATPPPSLERSAEKRGEGEGRRYAEA